MYVQRRFGGTREVITEYDMVMNPVADGLYGWPARRSITEPLPGKVREPVDLTITAGEQKLQGIQW
jgi:hypothetical protein